MISRCRRLRVKHVIAIVVTFLLLDYFGAFTHVFEKDFYAEFEYPLEGDIAHYVRQVRHGEKPDVPPLNIYNVTLLYNPREKCKDGLEPEIVFLVKSALTHFKRRNAIRSSWGHERRFSDVTIRTVFLLGVSGAGDESQKLVDIESLNFEDIVQSQFVDSYFNNTLKTMSGLRWAVEFCPKAKYYVFVDDDYYVSTKNILRYVKDPLHYPEYIQEADEIIRELARKLMENRNSTTFTESMQIREIERVLEKQTAHGHHSVDSRKYMAVIQSRYTELRMGRKHISEGQTSANPLAGTVLSTDQNLQRKLLSKELAANAKLFSGFVITSSPHRHKTSKWHITLEEYPYHMWPKYISAGSYLLSREALVQMYYTSWFTKTFRFDDIYLALVAMKAGIQPVHSDQFYFTKAIYSGPHSYKYVISSHGYGDSEEMVRVWSEVRAAGHA